MEFLKYQFYTLLKAILRIIFNKLLNKTTANIAQTYLWVFALYFYMQYRTQNSTWWYIYAIYWNEKFIYIFIEKFATLAQNDEIHARYWFWIIGKIYNIFVQLL